MLPTRQRLPNFRQLFYVTNKAGDLGLRLSGFWFVAGIFGGAHAHMIHPAIPEMEKRAVDRIDNFTSAWEVRTNLQHALEDLLFDIVCFQSPIWKFRLSNERYGVYYWPA
jgi:hypothetical protein